MVAETIELPNLRRMFVPDPGFIMIEGDLARADAQVVAWDAGDEPLKEIFRQGLDIHTENAKALYKLGDNEPADMQRHKAKAGIHAVNYVVSSKTLAATLDTTVYEAQQFIDDWFEAHPAIKAWHRRIERELAEKRSVTNIFGFTRRYFDRVDQLLPKATAWIGQSTVAIAIDKGMINVRRRFSRKEVQLLLQIHDSLLLQVPENLYPDIILELEKQMLITIPYDDPLIIPVTFSASSVSWGDGEPVDLEALHGKAA